MTPNNLDSRQRVAALSPPEARANLPAGGSCPSAGLLSDAPNPGRPSWAAMLPFLDQDASDDEFWRDVCDRASD